MVPCSQGAEIGEGTTIHTKNVSDFQLLTIGDNVVLKPGSSVCCHEFKDGKVCLHCSVCQVYDMLFQSA